MSRSPEEPQSSPPLAGQLLLAHPSLRDPNFMRSVILVSAHSEDDGALGVIINRPLGKTLGEFEGAFAYTPLASVPLFVGGPVAEDRMILTAWQWHLDEGRFQLHFGIDPERAKALLSEDPDVDLRGFVGYAGWGKGQLEDELESDSWVVCPVEDVAADGGQGDDLWRLILSEVSPEMRFLSQEPDDPSLN